MIRAGQDQQRRFKADWQAFVCNADIASLIMWTTFTQLSSAYMALSIPVESSGSVKHSTAMRILVSILLSVAIDLGRAQALSNNPGGPEQSASSHCVSNGTACLLDSSQTIRPTIITRQNSTLLTTPSTTTSLPTTPYTGQSLLTGS